MAVRGFQRIVFVDEHALECREARIGHHRQRQIAQMTIVALEEEESGRATVNHTRASVGMRDAA